MKPLSQISQKIDQFIRGLEKTQLRSKLIHRLQEQGFEGNEKEIMSTYRWLMGKEEPIEEPELDELDELEIDDEDEEKEGVKIERW